jgi:hypothetical protein
MRAIAIGCTWICLAACTPTATSPPSSRLGVARATAWEHEPDRPPVDPIVALAPDDTVDQSAPPPVVDQSWVVPGPVQLELGATAVGTLGIGRPVEVVAIDRQGNLERVAVRLEHARFSVWIDRQYLLSVLTRDQHIDVLGNSAVGSDVEVVLRAGARVRRLAHRARSTLIRYLGALQVEGWVPDSVLDDRGHVRDGTGRIPTGHKTLMVIPGAVIRAEPRWAGGALAIMANGYFLDSLREIDEAWSEVSYEDGDVAVHGFVSRRDPPGRVHRWRDNDTPPVILPNTTLASGTCLYARPGGDAIGYIVGNRPVDLDEAGPADIGWWTVSIDTPWGPLAFAAQGPGKSELLQCAPTGALPPATP